jgi:hypothetical protein
MSIELRDARTSAADIEWLTNVYPFYLHDLSEFDDKFYRLNEQGLWEPDHLPGGPGGGGAPHGWAPSRISPKSGVS